MSSILLVCPSLKNLRSTILECNRSEVCLKSTGRTSRKVVIGHLERWSSVISKGGHRSSLSCCSLLSDSTLPQYDVYKKLVWERGWEGGGKSDEDVYEVIIMDDSLCKLLPDLVILIEIEGVQWLETATCERGFSLDTQILTAQRHRMGDSLLACLIMICSNGPSLHRRRWRNLFLLSLRDSRLSRRGCRSTPTLNDPSVRLRPRPNPLFCLSFRVWRM
jgi:hypothetical protein